MELSSSFHLANNGTAGLGWLTVLCTTVTEKSDKLEFDEAVSLLNDRAFNTDKGV